MAERGGFEPPVGFYTYDGLANRCLRPLSHLSERCNKTYVWSQENKLSHPDELSNHPKAKTLIFCRKNQDGTSSFLSRKDPI
jgi:hypothetical protein